MPWPLFFTSSSLSPVAVGDTGGDGEQRNNDQHAGCNDHIPSLLFLRLLKFPPLQVAELAALAHVARYTAATGSTGIFTLRIRIWNSATKHVISSHMYVTLYT